VDKEGHIHPIFRIQGEIVNIFSEYGFVVESGPELESPHYNFDVLNMPRHHPSREMQETFWIGENSLMRTHTSNTQVRYLEKNEPPVKVIVPGKVFRNEATDASHIEQFYQCEGFAVSERESMSDLLGILDVFLKRFFGGETETRVRSSYFPFTEPSIEIDIKDGNGNFLEVAGAGMINPIVLKNAGIDSRRYRGFAFGFGVDRLAMLRYGVDDIRLFYKGDLRFINQF